MRIVAFGASTSRQSINKQFAIYAANRFDGADIEILDLNDYPLPVFCVDLQNSNGIPEEAIKLYNKFQSADLIIISLAEHNGTYTAAFKNLFDWVSRYQVKMFEQKKLFLLSTSTGQHGAQYSLQAALARFPRHGAEIITSFSLPNFYENFDQHKGIINDILRKDFFEKIELVKASIK